MYRKTMFFFWSKISNKQPNDQYISHPKSKSMFKSNEQKIKQNKTQNDNPSVSHSNDTWIKIKYCIHKHSKHATRIDAVQIIFFGLSHPHHVRNEKYNFSLHERKTSMNLINRYYVQILAKKKWEEEKPLWINQFFSNS